MPAKSRKRRNNSIPFCGITDRRNNIRNHILYGRKLPDVAKKKPSGFRLRELFIYRSFCLLASLGFETFVFSLGFVHFLGNLHGISLATLREHFVVKLVEFLIFGLSKLYFR